MTDDQLAERMDALAQNAARLLTPQERAWLTLAAERLRLAAETR